MTLRDYLKIFRQRWWVIVACALVAGAVMFIILSLIHISEPTRTY